MYYSPSPSTGWQWPWDGSDGLVTLATGQELAKLGQPSFKGRKKNPKPLNTKGGKRKGAGGGEGAKRNPSSPQVLLTATLPSP